MAKVSLDLNDQPFKQAKNLTGMETAEKIVTRSLKLLVEIRSSQRNSSLLWFRHSAGKLENSRWNHVSIFPSAGKENK
jgi:hypothetical protein